MDYCKLKDSFQEIFSIVWINPTDPQIRHEHFHFCFNERKKKDKKKKKRQKEIIAWLKMVFFENGESS